MSNPRSRSAELEATLGARAWARAGVEDHASALAALVRTFGERAFERDHYEPGHVTASAFVLSADETRLLLIRHKKLSLWLQPGGHVEPTDETLVEAARRELAEETGLVDALLVDPLFDVDVHAIPAFGVTPSHLHHDARVLFRALRDDVVRTDEVDDVAWFELALLEEHEGALASGIGTDESVRRVARVLRERSKTGRSAPSLRSTTNSL